MEVKWKEEETALTKAPIIKVPLQFLFEPVEILSKELTKLNSPYPYRILYLGPRWDNSSLTHKKFSRKHAYTFNEKQINTNSTFFNVPISSSRNPCPKTNSTGIRFITGHLKVWTPQFKKKKSCSLIPALSQVIWTAWWRCRKRSTICFCG